MDKESLIELRRALIEATFKIDNTKVKSADKLEAGIVLHHLFSEDEYPENIKALQKVTDKKYFGYTEDI